MRRSEIETYTFRTGPKARAGRRGTARNVSLLERRQQSGCLAGSNTGGAKNGGRRTWPEAGAAALWVSKSAQTTLDGVGEGVMKAHM